MPTKRTSSVLVDDIAAATAALFDCPFDGTTAFTPPAIPAIGDFETGLIVGPSGSGKSLLLSEFGTEETPEWRSDSAVCSHFASAEDAAERLAGVGFGSIPSWLRPHHVLSVGESFRANLARRLKNDAVIDEFTSTVDRDVAKSASVAVARFISKRGLRRIVFASCHYDIVEWLNPEWVFNTATGALTPRGSKCRPAIEIDLEPCGAEAWSMFSAHHYLSGEMNKAARCWLALWNGRAIGFTAILAFPRANLTNGWREHRTVVLPEFQGLGIGVRISDAVGRFVLAWGGRYFSKTAHPRMGAYRDASPLWRPTTKNRVVRKDYLSPRITKESNYKAAHAHRITWSHEFVGP